MQTNQNQTQAEYAKEVSKCLYYSWTKLAYILFYSHSKKSHKFNFGKLALKLCASLRKSVKYMK